MKRVRGARWAMSPGWTCNETPMPNSHPEIVLILARAVVIDLVSHPDTKGND